MGVGSLGAKNIKIHGSYRRLSGFSIRIYGGIKGLVHAEFSTYNNWAALFLLLCRKIPSLFNRICIFIFWKHFKSIFFANLKSINSNLFKKGSEKKYVNNKTDEFVNIKMVKYCGILGKLIISLTFHLVCGILITPLH